MNYATAAPDLERLPWLTDDGRSARPAGSRPLVLWSALAAVLIAGASYWLGMNSPAGNPGWADAAPENSSATVTLPQPLNIDETAGQESASAGSEAQPLPPAPTIVLDRAPRVRVTADSSRFTQTPRRTAAGSGSADDSAAEEEEAEAPKPLTLWPADQSTGAEGKIVRIGTFANSRQAKVGWRKLVRVYPGMNRLQATVVAKPSLRNGRTYYRLQFGTTSQAHSEVLCQWMKSIGQSCIVVGLAQEGLS